MAEFQNLDWTVFHWLNQAIANPVTDFFSLWLSDSRTWWVIGTLSLGTTIYFRKLSWLRILILAVALLGLTDLVTARVLKPYFGRVRPCYQQTVHVVDGCGGQFGFPSNHAANGAAVATTAFLLVGTKVGLFVSGVVFLVGLSRIILGVHFPSDILGGFIFGAIWAAAWILLLRRFFLFAKPLTSSRVKLL